MRSGGLAADGKPRRSIQLYSSLLQEVEHCVLTVVRPGRVRVLWGEPVVDAHSAEAGLVGEQLQGHVLHVVRAQGPASAMNVEVDARRLVVGTNEAQFDGTAAARDLDVLRLLQERWRRKDPLSFSPRAPRDLRSERVHRWLGADECFELRVECPSLVYVLLLDIGRGGPNPGHCASVLPRRNYRPPGGS